MTEKGWCPNLGNYHLTVVGPRYRFSRYWPVFKFGYCDDFVSCSGPFWDYIYRQSRAAQASEISTPDRHPEGRPLPLDFQGVHHAHIRPSLLRPTRQNRAAHFPYLPNLRSGNDANRRRSNLRRHDLRLRVLQRWRSPELAATASEKFARRLM